MVSALLTGNTTTVVVVIQSVAVVLHVAVAGQNALHVSRGGKTLRRTGIPVP